MDDAPRNCWVASEQVNQDATPVVVATVRYTTPGYIARRSDLSGPVVAPKLVAASAVGWQMVFALAAGEHPQVIESHQSALDYY